MTSGDVEVATLGFSNPAFGAASSGTATANAISDDTSATGGTIAKFKTQDRDNSEVYQGNVTLSGGGGDIELSSLNIIASDTVQMASLTYSAPP
jgi:archaellin